MIKVKLYCLKPAKWLRRVHFTNLPTVRENADIEHMRLLGRAIDPCH